MSNASLNFIRPGFRMLLKTNTDDKHLSQLLIYIFKCNKS